MSLYMEDLFKNGTETPLKIVVFDLDETLGYFVLFGVFWNAISAFFKRPLTQTDFNMTLDLYPEFLRPNIIRVLTFLKNKKDTNKCSNLMIYTNNQGPIEWVIFIKCYFEWKLGGIVFDVIIPAFKVGGKQVAAGRTSHRKTHSDFIRCSNVPQNSQICFVDDKFHHEMNKNTVYYIHVRPYIYGLTYSTLIGRYLDFHKSLQSSQFATNCMDYFVRYGHKYVPKSNTEYELDIISTNELLKHVKHFFNQSKTRRYRRRGSKTKRRK